MEMSSEKIERLETPYRRMVSERFPVPESLPVLEKLRKFETRSMHSQPPVVWDRAEGFQVYDSYGNKWLDWTSGVLVANAGHGAAEIRGAIVAMTEKSLLHNYLFPTEIRAKVAEKLIQLTPGNLNKVFFLTTGAEAVENAIKVMRTYGQRTDPKKIGLISFSGSFHGRTLGAQMIGGSPRLKEWIMNLDPDFHSVPFPTCYQCPLGRDRYKECDSACFGLLEETLRKKGVTPQQIAGVITESYQGSGAVFAPADYMRMLSDWCDRHNILLVFDEIQSGFGRTGRWFAFEHYDATPNLIVLGKGVSSSLPVAAVVGEERVMDIFDPGDMTSTHGGNPVCLAATLANINVIQEENLVENGRVVGAHFRSRLFEIKEKYPHVVGHIEGRGLVYGIYIVQEKGSKEPDGQRAADIVKRSVHKGLLVFSPIGLGSSMIKISPPLSITREAIDDGVIALEEAIGESGSSGGC